VLRWWAAKATVLTLAAGLAATAGGLPGVARAACQSGSGQGPGATASQVAQRMVAPVTAVLGVGETVPVLKTVPILGPLTAGAGDTNFAAAAQLAGLGALPGLADLPAAAPGTALSAASSGMSSDSFVALVVGAALAGASALMIAGRRRRDRRSGAAAGRVRDESSTLYPQAGTVRRCSPCRVELRMCGLGV
jgi:hypothetical protein